LNYSENIETAVRVILSNIEGKLRPGTMETPKRVAKAYLELFDGYDTDISTLFTTFDDEGTDQIVAVRDIEFNSMCEHHILPFSGTAHIAYLPRKKVIGASKIPRLVNAFAHRLQIQERMTEQIGNTLMTYLNPYGVAVIIEAQHSCMICRGVKSKTSKLITSVMLGKFRQDQALRIEVLSLLGLRNGQH
jgi:GTP cyclohydrolase I